MPPSRPVPPPTPTLAQAAADLRNGRASCLQLLEAVLARVDAWEADVHAWAFLDRASAYEQARRLDHLFQQKRDLGPLHGLPIAVKDIIDVAALPTACGAHRWAAGPAAADAPIVARLRAAGALILGKTVTTPYAWIDPPPTRNPHHLDHTPGGSSSGSAAAVACGMALGALGSQTGGSITRPASYCGVCGLKPTHGLLPLDGILPFAPTLDHPGPLARTITDLDLLWQALAPEPSRSPGSWTTTGQGAPLQLGRLRGPFLDRADAEMTTALENALAAFETAGLVRVRELPLPPAFDDIHRHHRAIMAAEAAAFHADRLARDPDDYPPRIRALIEEGLALPPSAVHEARRHRAAFLAGLDHWWPRDLAALITPAAPGPAPDTTTTGDPVMNSPWSYTGLPTVCFPLLRDSSAPNQLPLGLQLIARAYQERPLLALARQLETTPSRL